MEEKLNLSYKDYKVTKKDYFNDCPTMLTSEKAALALAVQNRTSISVGAGGLAVIFVILMGFK